MISILRKWNNIFHFIFRISKSIRNWKAENFRFIIMFNGSFSAIKHLTKIGGLLAVVFLLSPIVMSQRDMRFNLFQFFKLLHYRMKWGKIDADTKSCFSYCWRSKNNTIYSMARSNKQFGLIFCRISDINDWLPAHINFRSESKNFPQRKLRQTSCLNVLVTNFLFMAFRPKLRSTQIIIHFMRGKNITYSW